MKRGTIVCLNSGTLPELLPTFRSSGRLSPEFFRVLCKQMKPHGGFLAESRLDISFERYVGDLLEQGQGEILKVRQ